MPSEAQAMIAATSPADKLSSAFEHQMPTSPDELKSAPTTASGSDPGELARQRLAGMFWEQSQIAQIFYRSVIWLGHRLSSVGISPDALTYASLAFAALSGAAATTGFFGWAALAVLLSGVCDLLDGVVARVTNQTSSWGALLDSTVDRFGDALPMLGIAVFYVDSGRIAFIVPLLAMLGMFSLSYTRARAESLGAKLPPLFMRRAERFFLLVASLLLGIIEMDTAIAAPLLFGGIVIIGTLSYAATIETLRRAHQSLV